MQKKQPQPSKVSKPKSTQRKRGKGRPPSGKLMVGKEILIEKTCELLSELPPQKVTRVEVAKAVGVDPSLIRYYFKNRSALLLAAFERLTEEYSNILVGEKEKFDPSPEGQLRSRVAALFRLIKTYPHYHRLIIEEIAPMNTPESREVLSNLTLGRVASYKDILNQGAENGEFREVDPRLMFIAIIGMANFFTSGQEILKLAIGEDEIGEETANAYQELICDILLNGIRTN